MSAAMDRALMAMSLEEEDEPFIMPDLPGFCSNEANALSIIGRTLNQECQKMSKLILNLPRKWGKESKVRGVALSSEKFQFFFNTEHDLLDVLERGVQTQNEWVVVLERWVEHPPQDYLHFVPIWVQISKIPINYYTREAIFSLADSLAPGKVDIVAFDPKKSQTQEFVRVRIFFDVARLLKMSKVVKLPCGTSTTVHFHYEKILKRCHSCYRLNHEKDKCPLIAMKRKAEALERNKKTTSGSSPSIQILKEGDPLFGVLEETQVCVDPLSGRPRIAPEVLDEMRRYLLSANREESFVREIRAKSSVKEAESNPFTQKLALTLEPLPLITINLELGKGPVFDYGRKEKALLIGKGKACEFDPMDSAIRSGNAMRWDPVDLNAPVQSEDGGNLIGTKAISLCSTGFSIGFSEPCYSGTSKKKLKHRKRPHKSKRKPSPKEVKVQASIALSEKQKGKQIELARKRKYLVQEEELATKSVKKCLEVVPKEGPPTV